MSRAKSTLAAAGGCPGRTGPAVSKDAETANKLAMRIRCAEDVATMFFPWMTTSAHGRLNG